MNTFASETCLGCGQPAPCPSDCPAGVAHSRDGMTSEQLARRKAKQELRNARKAFFNAVRAAERAAKSLDFATGRLEVAVAAITELS